MVARVTPDISSLNFSVSKLLDEQLCWIFGDSFARVVEFVVREEIHSDLHAALRSNPGEVVGVLRKMFKGKEKVALVFWPVIKRLGTLQPSPENEALVQLLIGLPLEYPQKQGLDS